MNVLVITSIFPPDIGGPATYVPLVVEGLARRGHRIRILTLSDSVREPDGTHPCPVIRLPRGAFKPFRWMRTMLEIGRMGRWADVLFVNGLALESAVVNEALRLPMVLKVVGDLVWERATSWGWIRDGFEDFQSREYGPVLATLKKARSWWTSKACRVIVPSRYLAEWVRRWGVSPSRIVVIRNAVEPYNGGRGERVAFPAPVKAVTAGRLVRWKRVDRILEALAGIRDLGLVVIGDGPERARLEGLAASLGVMDRVQFAGSRSPAETRALMCSCDLFVLNSTYEGFPHVVLEGMMAGLPVVATAAGGTPEIVEDGKNGRLIRPDATVELERALAALAASPGERRRLAEGARRTAEGFSISEMVGSTAEALEGAARKGDVF